MLKRDTKDGLIFGVCSGLAKHLGVNIALVRVLTALSFICTGSITFWAYLAFAIFLPKETVE